MSSSEISKLNPIYWIKKVFRSLFAKLFLILVITGLCIHIVVLSAFRSGTSHYRQAFQENVSQYLNYLVQDLGTPPNYERAKELANHYSLKIHYEGLNESWSTSPSFPPIAEIDFHQWRKFPHLRLGHYRGNYLAAVQTEPGELIFSIDLSHEHEEAREIWIMGVLILLPVILIVAYFAIRRVLRPIRWLNEGVQAVAEGDLKHRVPEKRSDELGDLSKAFNTMTHRIDHMLQSKEQLLLDVSHEFRSPLTRIKVALEFLKDHPAQWGIREDIHELEKMVAEILESARLDSAYGHLNRQKTDLIALIEEVIESCEAPSGRIDFHSLAHSLPLNVDGGRIKIVLRNIINNALKYSSSAPGAVRVSVHQAESHAIIQVQDSGEGIPQEELPYIFEPFYRVDKSRSKATGGYGLGLHLCKKIMEAHEGKIEAAASPSQGTTLSLFLPLGESF